MNCQATLPRNISLFLDLTCLLSDDHLNVIIEAFIFFLTQSSVEAEKRAFNVNE